METKTLATKWAQTCQRGVKVTIPNPWRSLQKGHQKGLEDHSFPHSCSPGSEQVEREGSEDPSGSRVRPETWDIQLGLPVGSPETASVVSCLHNQVGLVLKKWLLGDAEGLKVQVYQTWSKWALKRAEEPELCAEVGLV